MSSIEKLSIQGVRSFSPNSVEEIKFQTPLTLIVGTNGSGKTTIIECLKYATTGDMPPMSKSNGFLTDPQFYNITTVNAMVKLHFKNINNKLVITRNSSLSVDPTSASKKSTFKTLTKTLEDFNLKTNEKITHEPSKTIAIEDILNKYIGVSKPILDYVIFAHQEDSLWPLSDSNTLKKRFDEIFEVSRFTKELQNLNSIKKNIKVDIKLREGDLNNCKDNLKKYHVVQDRIVKLNKTLNLYDAERVQLEEKLKEIADAQQNLMNINQSYVDIINEFTQLTSSKDNMLKQLHEMSKKYPRIDERESRDQLNHELEKVINSIKGLTVETSSDYPHQLERFNSLLEKCNAVIVTKSTQLGGLKQAEKSYHLNKKEVNELTEKHSYLNPLSKDEVRKIMDKKQFELGEFMKKVKEKSDEFKSVINECRTNIGKMEFENKHLSMQSSTLESEMTVLQSKISNLESNILYRNGNAETVEYENRKLIDEIEKELANELSDASISQKEDELKLKTSHLQELDEALASIRKNIIKAKQGSESSTMFHLRKSDLTRSLKASSDLKVCGELENLVSEFNTYNKDINFDSSDGIKTYIEELNGLQTRLSDLLSKNTITYKNSTSEIKNLETTKSQLTTKLNKETLDLKRSEKLIKELKVQKSNYEETLSDKLDLTSDKPTLFQNFEDNLLILKENLDDINDSIGTNTGMIQVFQHAKKTILKKKCCNICKTSFENDEEKMNLALEYVNKKINTDVNESIKEKEQAEKEYNEYLKLRTILEKYCDCREKLLKESNDFKILLFSKETSEVELSKLTRSIEEVESTIKKVENSIKCIESWYDFVKNISEQSMKLQEMRKDLDEHHTDEHIDINALAGKQDTMVAKRTELSTSISSLSSEISSLKASKVNKEHSKSKYEAEIIRSKEIQEEASSLKEQLFTKESILSKNKEVLNQNTEQIIKLKDELLANQKQLESHEGENGGKIKLLEQESDQMKTVTRRVFDQLLPEIKKYEDFEQENIKKCTEELEGLEAEASSLKQKITDTNQLIQKARVELETCNKKKEEINQVLNYLTMKEEYIIICDKLANINEQEVMEYQNEYSSTAQELNMAFTDISSEISSKKGEIRQIKNQIETDVKTRDNDYADIEQKYHEINCNSKTLLNMEHDLDIASKIIEMSIMNFHSKKMEEINVLLDELWRTTYKGSDIATIKIVTEKVKKNSTASGSNIESYNYKVVMYKDSLEIDMRGRCSAGQKVMACILIRLALAETFGVSCGVITLDEPTTNLDQENAEGLAESLHRIIESRRFQQNFQIVIITHDENFLKFMNAQDFTDGFWKVSKDNNLASKIEWKSIENLIQ